MEIFALVYDDGARIYLYSSEEKAESALIQKMTEAVRNGWDLDFSGWEIRSAKVDEGEDLME